MPIVPESSTSDLLDEKQLSRELNISVRTLRNWRSKGEGPSFVKLGKRTVRYRRSAKDEFVAEGSKVIGGGL